MDHESKEQRFIRIAERRTQSVLDDLRALSKCARTASYRYTAKQVDTIFSAIDQAVSHVKAQFDDRTRFRLSTTLSEDDNAETEEFMAYKQKLLYNITPGDLLEALNHIQALCAELSAEEEAVEDAMQYVEEAQKKLLEFQTDNLCPRCGAPLFLSDLPQYEAVCYRCAENF